MNEWDAIGWTRQDRTPPLLCIILALLTSIHRKVTTMITLPTTIPIRRIILAVGACERVIYCRPWEVRSLARSRAPRDEWIPLGIPNQVAFRIGDPWDTVLPYVRYLTYFTYST